MPIGAVLGVVGGLAQASAAKKAAKAQTNAANNDIAFQRETRDLIFDRYAPFYDAGQNALAAYNSELGLGDAPEGYGGFTKTPGYDFRLKEGVNALEGSAAARGQLFSGNTAKALTRYGQDYATGEYQNYLSRLAGMTDSGMAAAGGQASAATNTAAGISNAYSNIGNAQAAGAIGVGNAFANGINNGVGIWGYQQALNSGGPQQANALSTPWASQGFWG